MKILKADLQKYSIIHCCCTSCTSRFQYFFPQSPKFQTCTSPLNVHNFHNFHNSKNACEFQCQHKIARQYNVTLHRFLDSVFFIQFDCRLILSGSANIYIYILGCPFNRISIAHYIGSIYWPNRSLDPKYLEIWCSRFLGNWVQSLQISLINEKLFLPYLTVQFSTFLFLRIWEEASVKVFLSKISNFGPTSMKFHPISWIFL